MKLHPSTPPGSEVWEQQLVETLNRECRCISVDQDQLRRYLESDLGEVGISSRLLATRPHLLAASPVFLSPDQVARIREVIRAIEVVLENDAYQREVEAWSPAICHQDHGPRGVFFGYDFHLCQDGPKLIEINTNAGGALLNLYLARAQRACCAEVANLVTGTIDLSTFEDDLVAMFRSEWLLQRPDRELRTIAIADENPQQQFLHPELLLFESLFERHGIAARISDPRHFTHRQGALWLDDTRVDLVYNRLTDFYLDAPESAPLREAYESGSAVVTPSPRGHALYANKRNLTLLSDPGRLAGWGVDAAVTEILQKSVPRSVVVTADDAKSLWSERKRLFFKPLAGYGSRGAYRGAKLTRRVWQSILESEYIAQEMIPPSERRVVLDGVARELKLDVRAYVYDRSVQLLAARMYQGQTTNLRTEGGGLASVFTLPPPLQRASI